VAAAGVPSHVAVASGKPGKPDGGALKPGRDAMAAADVVCRFEGVFKIFPAADALRGRSSLVAVHDVTLEVLRGELVTLLGPSGCGKSTLLSMLAGLAAPTAGRVVFQGHTITAPNTAVGYVSQDDHLLPWRTLLENVQLPLEFRGVPSRVRHERALEQVATVGLAGFEGSYPHELSGGMRKRAAVARALVADPDTLLMDEPFGSLDAQTRLILQRELLRLWEGTGRTVVFVTHDLLEAIALSDRIVVLTRRPARVKTVHTVALPRPRDPFDVLASPAGRELHEALWSDLRDELAVSSSGMS
jgi:NitT/TauT family transport system ATP-binding protein